MKKNIFLIMSIAVALCACSKDFDLTSNDSTPMEEGQESIVFTASMENSVTTKARFDSEEKCASWEVYDTINVNGSQFIAKDAGTSTTFSKSKEVRPTFVGSSSGGFSQEEGPASLVDKNGTQTKWCASTEHQNIDKVWDIVVCTDAPSNLIEIKLWNGNDTQEYPGRSWRAIRVYGALSKDDQWEKIGAFVDLNLEKNNSALAGIIKVASIKKFQFYKIEIPGATEGNIMQMSDMKFEILDDLASYQMIEGPYLAYFPSNLYNGTSTTLPSEISEKWSEEKFNMPMYAYSTDTNLEFKNLCGVLKITVKDDLIASIKRIRVRSANKAMSGKFVVDKNYKAVLNDASATNNTITITYTEAIQTDASGKVFYVAVPAQTYQELQIELDPDGTRFITSMTTKASTNINIERNKIYPITFSDNAAIKGTATATIQGKEVNVNWVQLWLGGPKFAEFNVGAKQNKVVDYGGYYCWGKCIDQDPDGHYDEGNTNLSGDRDTATNMWGSNWRMPTIEEFITLTNNDESGRCSLEWISNYKDTGVNGILISGKGKYASNSIFLPAVGCYINQTIDNRGVDACYWSSTPGGPQGAPILNFSSDCAETHKFLWRYCGSAVRAVLAEK
ncbi:MAG: hypothetical protein KBS95_00995 [Alistipes sp.]|nr:hypothetical protein [Candidatus Alistipes equi]